MSGGAPRRTRLDCIICRRTDGGFHSQEHIVPESLGNNELILPPGVVCDRCNNEVLASLDQQLCDFHPIQMLRTFVGIRNKVGRYPTVRAVTGRITRTDDVVQFLLNDPNDQRSVRVKEQRDDGTVVLSTNTTGGAPITDTVLSKISRALLKMGLESLWLDEGDRVLDERLDHVRHAILGAPRSGFVMWTERHGSPYRLSRLRTYSPPHAEGVHFIVELDFCGLRMATDSRLERPVSEAPDGIAVHPFTLN